MDVFVVHLILLQFCVEQYGNFTNERERQREREREVCFIDIIFFILTVILWSFVLTIIVMEKKRKDINILLVFTWMQDNLKQEQIAIKTTCSVGHYIPR